MKQWLMKIILVGEGIVPAYMFVSVSLTDNMSNLCLAEPFNIFIYYDLWYYSLFIRVNTKFTYYKIE